MTGGIDTLKLGVIGDPIGHSLSPFLHGSVIEKLGLDAVYLPYRVTGEETRRFHEAAAYMGFTGYNATMPHKIHLMDIVDELDESARQCGSVNTVRFRDGISRGYNTDAEGLMRALKGRGIVLPGSHVMMLGAGGAAGALARGFAAEGAGSVTILNRTEDKAASVAASIRSENRYSTVFEAGPLSAGKMRETAAASDIIVNCTPVGMAGVGSCFDDLSFLNESRAFVCDLIYNPWKTDLLQAAEDHGLAGMNGLDMLIYQGLLAFEIFTDRKLDLDGEFRRLYPLCAERLL